MGVAVGDGDTVGSGVGLGVGEAAVGMGVGVGLGVNVVAEVVVVDVDVVVPVDAVGTAEQPIMARQTRMDIPIAIDEYSLDNLVTVPIDQSSSSQTLYSNIIYVFD